MAQEGYFLRNEALRRTKGRSIERELEEKDIYARSAGRKTMREEFPEAYKDVSAVVEVVQKAGLAKKVATNQSRWESSKAEPNVVAG